MMEDFDPTHVSEHEHGIVRVFAADAQLAMDIGDSGDYDLLCRALGIERIDPEQVQQVQTAALADMTVSDFLREGYEVDVAEPQVREALDATAKDDVLLLVIRSAAFLDRPVKLIVDGDVKLIATLREPGVDVVFKTLPEPNPSEILQDQTAKKTPSDAAMGGRVATIALLVMALLVWVMIKVAS